MKVKNFPCITTFFYKFLCEDLTATEKKLIYQTKIWTVDTFSFLVVLAQHRHGFGMRLLHDITSCAKASNLLGNVADTKWDLAP